MPNTVNIGLSVPNTGDLPGAWGTAAVNPNMQIVDGLLGGFVSLALSSATTIALTTTTAALTPSAGPDQSSNSLLRFVGTLTGNVTIAFTRPGFYIVENKCVVGGFCVALAPSSGTGNVIGAPPGEKCHVFYDGVSMDYVDLGRVGEALDLHGATAIPAWISVCTVPPYLLKNGLVYTSSIFPALAAMLGSTFGGNGITTFGVPDELSRVRLPLDTSATGRVTAGISGINGTTMGSAGGNQFLQAHSHGITDPGHTHTQTVFFFSSVQGGTGAGGVVCLSGGTGTTTLNSNNSTTNISINVGGSGTSQNMPPAIVSFLPLIKT
jgi:microcystin-dependent protein